MILSVSCFRLQRYKLLKAIHNLNQAVCIGWVVVSDYKDTNFWKQFTTIGCGISVIPCCFRLQRYKLLKAIHNCLGWYVLFAVVVSDYKDTNFWKQFTTRSTQWSSRQGCFRLQRYKLLKAIHNNSDLSRFICALFQTTKIQTFESNSQPSLIQPISTKGCFRLQRYKLLKAIHNYAAFYCLQSRVVSDYKDTNFWKQFTTCCLFCTFQA